MLYLYVALFFYMSNISCILSLREVLSLFLLLQLNEFLTGAGTDAPDVDDENATPRQSVGYEDVWAITLLETYEVEVQSL